MRKIEQDISAKGRVILVGAGCGPADLITLRGREAIRTADAIVYDALIDPDLLQYASPAAECIPAGKRSGRHSMPQEEINALLIHLAREGKKVCRLKGGDPFVFGRGGEEIEALHSAGIPVEEIPGVTSAVAVPAASGIPVTHRGISRSFRVITAHTANTPDGLPEHMEQLAGLEGTLVFLMGLKNLPALSARLLAAGMPEDTPAAICGVKTLRGTLKNIAALAVDAVPPVVIVIGGSAGLDLWNGHGPLFGAAFGLTGTAAFRSRVRRSLEALGAHVTDVQRSRIFPVCTETTLMQELDRLPGWIAFTSPNGVDQFFRLLSGCRFDLRCFSGVRFAAVGPRTAEVLAQHGLYADLVPKAHNTDALGRELAAACSGSDVLLATAEQCSPAPQLALEHAGIPFRKLVLYRAVVDAPCACNVDYLVFGSARSALSYFQAGGSLPVRACLCIGKATATAAARYGAVLVASDTTPDALAETAVEDWISAVQKNL